MTDISQFTALFTVAGPGASEVLGAAGATAAGHLAPGGHALLQCGGSPVVVAAGGALGASDFTLLADEAIAGDLWRTLTSQARSVSPAADRRKNIAPLTWRAPQHLLHVRECPAVIGVLCAVP